MGLKADPPEAIPEAHIGSLFGVVVRRSDEVPRCADVDVHHARLRDLRHKLDQPSWVDDPLVLKHVDDLANPVEPLVELGLGKVVYDALAVDPRRGERKWLPPEPVPPPLGTVDEGIIAGKHRAGHRAQACVSGWGGRGREEQRSAGR